MLNEPTIEKLKGMNLEGMYAAWLEQQSTASSSGLAFDERFAMLVDAEWTHRDNKRNNRSLKEAKLRYTQACIESIDYAAKRELVDKAVVKQLATCRWVKEHQAILITGMTGTGKSWLACAFAHQACKKGFRALYRRAPRFFDELRLARADGTYQRLLARLARIDVLIVRRCARTPVRRALEPLPHTFDFPLSSVSSRHGGRPGARPHASDHQARDLAARLTRFHGVGSS